MPYKRFRLNIRSPLQTGRARNPLAWLGYLAGMCLDHIGQCFAMGLTLLIVMYWIGEWRMQGYYRPLAERGRTAKALIVRQETVQNEKLPILQYVYQFETSEGRRQEGALREYRRDQPRQGIFNPGSYGIEHPKVGQSLTVTYLPEDPRHHVPRAIDAPWVRRHLTQGFPLTAILGVFIVIILLMTLPDGQERESRRRLTIEPSGGGVRIAVRNPRHWVLILFFTIWLTGWSFMAFGAMLQINPEDLAAAFPENVIRLLIRNIPFLVAGLLPIGFVAWFLMLTLNGRDEYTVRERRLTIHKQRGIFFWNRCFSCNRIEAVRFHRREGKNGGCSILVAADWREWRFGAAVQLNVEEAKEIAEALSAWMPVDREGFAQAAERESKDRRQAERLFEALNQGEPIREVLETLAEERREEAAAGGVAANDSPPVTPDAFPQTLESLKHLPPSTESKGVKAARNIVGVLAELAMYAALIGPAYWFIRNKGGIPVWLFIIVAPGIPLLILASIQNHLKEYRRWRAGEPLTRRTWRDDVKALRVLPMIPFLFGIIGGVFWIFCSSVSSQTMERFDGWRRHVYDPFCLTATMSDVEGNRYELTDFVPMRLHKWGPDGRLRWAVTVHAGKAPLNLFVDQKRNVYIVGRDVWVYDRDGHFVRVCAGSRDGESLWRISPSGEIEQRDQGK